MSERVWVLSPGDLGTLWEECRRCFYLATAAAFPRPVGGALSSLNVVGRQLVTALGGRRTEQIVPGMPAGMLEPGHRSVQSETLSIQVPDGSYRCVLRGALELTMTLDDGTLGVLEVGTAGPQAGARVRRLHGWAHALESAGAGKVSALGVLIFEPAPKPSADAPLAVGGTWQWFPVARDDAMFYGLLAEVLSLLERPAPPGGTPLCSWCVYRDASRRTGY